MRHSPTTPNRRRLMTNATQPRRGVFATLNDFPGMTEVRVFDSEGRLRMKVTVASEDLDRQLMHGFEHWLNRKDPVVKELRAV